MGLKPGKVIVIWPFNGFECGEFEERKEAR
jgi:hypothetical protein